MSLLSAAAAGPGTAWGSTAAASPAQPSTAADRRARSRLPNLPTTEVEQNYTAAAKKARFFNVFQVIRFPNTECVSNEEGTNGTCYLPDECSQAGGSARGSCAEGYGVCCVFSAGCGEAISRNNTVFRGPGNLTSPFNCRLTVSKINENICQMRLDFDQLSLASPDANGVCRQDQFTVIGAASSQPPVICGVNGGQHMYVDVSPGSGSQLTLQATTSGTETTARDWRVRVSQIACDNPARAPAGCLQYYTNSTGTIKSFSFDTNEAGPHLASQRYAICVRTNAGFCGIQYDACSALNNFTVSESLGAVKGSSCTDDFLTIATVTPDGFTGTPQDRHCGTEWSGDTSGVGPGVTFSRPFVVYVRFNDNETTVEQEGSNRGFCLDYTQVPCSSVSSTTSMFQRLQLPPPDPLLQRPAQHVSSGVLSVSNPADTQLLSFGQRPQRPLGHGARAARPSWQQRANFYYG
ncbi:uncharacterized protein LOC119106035 [Pollicipes pollicipes]|uniref:uncharacterized protein LOC119106035 n=1 Tax=Pollicipes pollicipes TaxID=41117 RepID=UPI001884B41D|nr:uncharacterized protein LOC119106035 [Pollicipes pollicipes]